MELVLGITLVILIIIFLRLYYPWIFSPLTEVTAKDGQKYLVLNHRDKQAAADKLADIKQKLMLLIDDFQYENDSSEDINRLKKRFKAVISENAPGGEYTSYTVNKGEHIYMCLREDNRLVDDNVLMFVALHELAHVMTKSIGHQRDFKENFRMLLKFAQQRGYYSYQPYHVNPVKYCGTKISALP
jgi:predicted metal-dependent hydrolase